MTRSLRLHQQHQRSCRSTSTVRAAADTLVGNDIDNSLFGGAGCDTMWGGAGRNSFVFDTSPKSGRDFIKDFYVPQDTIKL